jgi:hypothetical protein
MIVLSVRRHEEVDASLRRIHEYLTALAAEIDEGAPAMNKQGDTYQIAVTVAAWSLSFATLSRQTRSSHPAANSGYLPFSCVNIR